MKKDPQVFLKHILDSIESIEKYTHGLMEKEFYASSEKQDAVIRKIEVIGEAVRNLAEDFKEQYPNIVWRKIAGMRDKLIHEYFEVDLELVWEVTQKDLPILKENILKIARPLD